MKKGHCVKHGVPFRLFLSLTENTGEKADSFNLFHRFFYVLRKSRSWDLYSLCKAFFILFICINANIQCEFTDILIFKVVGNATLPAEFFGILTMEQVPEPLF